MALRWGRIGWRPFAIIVLLVLLPLPALLPGARAAGDVLRAGVGVGDFTPPVGSPMFGYPDHQALVSGVAPFLLQPNPDTNLYAKTFLATTGRDTRVKARAVVLDSGGVRLALVATDLGAVPAELHDAVAARLGPYGIDGDHLLVSATHTHGSLGGLFPPTYGLGLLAADLFDARLFGLTADAIAGAVIDAVEHLTPARLGIAQVDVADATENRRLHAYARNPDAPPSTRPDLRPGSIDTTLTAIRIDTAGGRPLGLFSVFAIHGTSLRPENPLITADNHGVAERVVEEEIRRRTGLPEGEPVVHALANGAEGDTKPRGTPPREGEVPGALPLPEDSPAPPTVWVTSDHARAELAGRRVARGALEAWELAGRTMTGEVALDARSFVMALSGQREAGEPVGPLGAAGCGGVVCPGGTKRPVDVPGQGSKLVLVEAPGIVPNRAPLQVVRIGSLVLGALPVEPTTQLGRRAKASLLAATADLGVDRVAIVGVANGYLAYNATPEEYEAYDYEGSLTIFGRQQGPLLLRGLAELAEAMATGRPAPAGAADPLFLPPSAPRTPPLLAEPSPGVPLVEPGDVSRFGTVTFTWSGGDPALDDPHVSIERNGDSGWQAVTTDDGFEDTVTYDRPASATPHRWTERWETAHDTPTGTYRIVASGRTRTGPYRVVSTEFRVRPAAGPAATERSVRGRTVVVRGAYPEPGPDALRVRPRFSEGGRATVTVRTMCGTTTVVAPWNAATGRYEARIPGCPPVEVLAASIADGEGNGG